jgi:DNA-binding Lrp family transcriptional regulator
LGRGHAGYGRHRPHDPQHSLPRGAHSNEVAGGADRPVAQRHTERVSRLEKAGIIRGYRADIGQLDDGQIQAFLLVTLKRTPSIGVLDRLAGFSAVRKVSSVSGQLDLVVEVEVGSINALNELRNEVSTMDNVEDLTTSIVLRRDIERS